MFEKNKKVSKDGFDTYLQESRGLEKDYIKEIISSRASWRRFGFVCLFLAFMGLAAGWAGLSQTAPDPLVLMVSENGGDVQRVTTMTERVSYNEVVDEYWLNLYTNNREGYDHNTVQATYDTTALLSSAPVQQEFVQEYYTGETSRTKIYGDKARIFVTVRSIQIQDTNRQTGQSIAAVRFSTQLVWNDGRREPAQSMIAQVSYKYLNVPMTVRDRRINPLGIQILSYRAVPETLR